MYHLYKIISVVDYTERGIFKFALVENILFWTFLQNDRLSSAIGIAFAIPLRIRLGGG